MNFHQGVDLLDIRRIKKVLDKYNKRFVNRIFSSKELNFLYKNFSNQRLVEKIANGFAVKEAAAKALGTGFSQGIRFLDFELFYDSNNRPFISITSKVESKIRKNHKEKINIYVSISNEKNFVVAIVTIISF